MISRSLGIKMPSNEIRKLKPGDAHDLFDDDNLALMAKCNIETIAF